MRNELRDAACGELGKVFILACRGVEVQMFSPYIDDVWHELLNDEENYKRFCLQSCGHIIPHSASAGAGLISFVEAYENEFGKLPEIWFRDKNGQLDRTLADDYARTGEVLASWDCTPTHACMQVVRKPTDERRTQPDARPDTSQQEKDTTAGQEKNPSRKT